MTHRHRLSENEKLYLFVFLFPPLWPLGLAMLLCEAAKGIGSGIRELWRKMRR